MWAAETGDTKLYIPTVKPPDPTSAVSMGRAAVNEAIVM